jgi:hypothetical protein
MERKHQVRLAAVGVALVLLWSAQPALGQTAKQKKDQLNRYLKQMQDRFNSWDLNKNSELDKAELAKAFRGPDAKPFDDGADDAKIGPIASVLVTVPVPTPMMSFPVAELLTQKGADPPPPQPKPDYSSYPDYQFLVLVAKNGQTKVTRPDFDAWARQYAQQVQQQQFAQTALQKAQSAEQKAERAVAQAQAKVQAAKTAGQLKKAQAALRRPLQNQAKTQATLQQSLQNLNQANTQLAAVPPAIRQAFPLKK